MVLRGYRSRTSWPLVLLLWLLLAALVGCAKFNTYYNAKKAFDEAEAIRDDALKRHQDPGTPSGQQKTKYQTAITKSQKILDEYPGNSLTDDVLFLQGKAYFRLESYRMSAKKLDLLFVNFPQTEYLEESFYLQALNYLLVGMTDRSQEYLDRLAKSFPHSRYLSETLVVRGDNAYSLRAWDEAAATYAEYLDRFPDAADRDRVALKLARTYWEMHDYSAAADVLQQIGQDADSAELAFRARLLQARVNVRTGDFEVAELLLKNLWDEAETYSAQGDVRVVEAENLVAQGRQDEAAPLLENMPQEWQTATATPLAADILGYIYIERGKWDFAMGEFTKALRGRDYLDDKERSQRMRESLQDYMSAENSLASATGDRVPRLKLLQANAMLLGFDRPGEAARLYVEAAADTAADSTVTTRALYGAVITYRDHLDKPDSAAIFADELEQRFPDSPQTFELINGTDADLLQYLLTQQKQEQAEHLAELSPEALLELQTVADATGERVAVRPRAELGLRRQMVYLSRRPNLVYEPPPMARQLLAERQAAGPQAPLPGSLPAGPPGPAPGAEFYDPGAAAAGAAGPQRTGAAATDSLLTGEAAGEAAGEATSGQATGDQATGAAETPRQEAPADDETSKQDEKKDKKKSDWEFDLR